MSHAREKFHERCGGRTNPTQPNQSNFHAAKTLSHRSDSPRWHLTSFFEILNLFSIFLYFFLYTSIRFRHHKIIESDNKGELEMTLKQLQAKYPQFTIARSNSSYGNYSVRLLPNHIEFFFKLVQIDIFISRHLKDVASGNQL
jgi:hypothetical protein